MKWRGHYIKGQWIDEGERQFSSKNPSDNSIMWEGLSADARLVASAISAARDAFGAWSRLGVDRRMEYLDKFEKALRKSRVEFARIISMENGKPLWESSQEIITMMDKIGISLKAYRERCKITIHENQGFSAISIHKPVGVFGVIGPFNLPGHLPNGHIIPALIAGNTIVFKPSEFTPLVGQTMMELWAESGIPDGVVNLVQGRSGTGAMLGPESGLDGLLFTGSYDTGKKIHEAYAGHPEKILALEMGGNNPLVVWDFESLPSATYVTILSGLITSGQRCSCARRIIVPDTPEGAEFVTHLRNSIAGIRIGSWNDDPEPFMGPLIHESAAGKIVAAFNALKEMGGIPLASLEILENKKSHAFVVPGMIDMTGVGNVPDAENFGPLLQVYRARDFEEAIMLANRTSYGLSAGLISRDRGKFDRFMESVRAGVINWNRAMTGASSSLPFGGAGKSGNFRPSGYYSADYCSYAVASLQADRIEMPQRLNPGLEIAKEL